MQHFVSVPMPLNVMERITWDGLYGRGDVSNENSASPRIWRAEVPPGADFFVCQLKRKRKWKQQKNTKKRILALPQPVV